METAAIFFDGFEEALDSIGVVMIYNGLMDVEPVRKLVSKLYGKVCDF